MNEDKMLPLQVFFLSSGMAASDTNGWCFPGNILQDNTRTEVVAFSKTHGITEDSQKII